MLQNILEREKEEVIVNHSNQKQIFGGNPLTTGNKLNKSSISYLANDSTNSYAIGDKPYQYENFFITIHIDNKSFNSVTSKNIDEMKPQNKDILHKQSTKAKDSSKNSKNILIEHSKNAKLINYVAVINSPKFKVPFI